VLPFVNTNKDQDNEYFADGLSEELLNVLTRIRGLRVASRTSAFYFKGKDVDLATVARKLNVAAILEGSVRKAGKRVRITADLIHVATDSRLWSQTYDRELDDIFAVQDDIAQSVVKELRAALLGDKPDVSVRESVKEEVQAAVKGRGANAEAYRLCLQGRFFVERYTEAGIAKGIAHYRQALELDPGYALAWTGLSVAYASQSRQGFARSTDAFGHAREAAERALQSEPELPEAHLALGLVRMDYDWDWPGAESSIRRALTLAPGNAEVVSVAAELMLTLGRLDEAIALSRRAVMLDPLSVTTHKNLGRHCFYAGHLDEAEVALARMLEISPQCGLAHYLLGYVRLMQRRPIEALAEFEQEPLPKFRLLGLTLVHHTQGRTTKSDEALRELVERESVVGACQIAWAYAYRGDADRAFEWLERAYARRDTPSWLSRHPLLRNLHADSRWRPFLQKTGLTA
jgi:TolB-like protein